MDMPKDYYLLYEYYILIKHNEYSYYFTKY